MAQAGRARGGICSQPEFPSADLSSGIVPPATTCDCRAGKMKILAQCWRSGKQDTLLEISAEGIGPKMNHPIAARAGQGSQPCPAPARIYPRVGCPRGLDPACDPRLCSDDLLALAALDQTASRHNIHGMFIPFVVAYFIRKELRSDQIVDAEQSAWGFLFLIPGLGMMALDSAIRTQLLSAFGMVVCLPVSRCCFWAAAVLRRWPLSGY